jgi:Holliday junction DNA helicase RuvB
VFIEAAKGRGQPLDHVLFFGPPGLGKTTLAMIVANELGVPFVHTSGPCIDKPGDLAGILAGLVTGSVLFIDEIHRLPIAVEEVLYTAMEDFSIDIIVGQGSVARTVRMPVQPFTLVGATTRMALLSSPLVSRFGIQERLDYYSNASLVKILQRSATIEGTELTEDGAFELARRSRGTPRVANRLLRRVRDFAEILGEDKISAARVDMALARLSIDQHGLDPMDRRILSTIWQRYNGGPVGLETLSHTVAEDKSTVEEVYEPFLVHSGFLVRGPRGRELTEMGKQHVMTFVES